MKYEIVILGSLRQSIYKKIAKKIVRSNYSYTRYLFITEIINKISDEIGK